jgi:hypothetical protein
VNKLSAIRNFSNPGYCPVKSTRLYNDKWYLVEMQDVERNPMTDYVGLADTSTVYLWPGNKTRQERDSRLNHCNKIVEYTGNVFALTSDKMRIIEYYPSMQSANQSKQTHEIDIANSLNKALQSIDSQSAWHDSEILKHYGNCNNWPGNETVKIAEFRQSLIDSRKRNIAYWQSDITIKQIR